MNWTPEDSGCLSWLGHRLVYPGFESQRGKKFFFFPKSRSYPGTTQPHIQCVAGFCPAGEDKHSLSSGAEIRTDGAILHSYIWFHAVGRDNFTVTCIFSKKIYLILEVVCGERYLCFLLRGLQTYFCIVTLQISLCLPAFWNVTQNEFLRLGQFSIPAYSKLCVCVCVCVCVEFRSLVQRSYWPSGIASDIIRKPGWNLRGKPNILSLFLAFSQAVQNIVKPILLPSIYFSFTFH